MSGFRTEFHRNSNKIGSENSTNASNLGFRKGNFPGRKFTRNQQRVQSYTQDNNNNNEDFSKTANKSQNSNQIQYFFD